jgi:hypothetical protein
VSFVVYTRRGCHLCEVLVEQLLEEVGEGAAPELRDIDTKAEWQREFDTRVPVLEYNGHWVCDYRLDVERLRELLALDRGEAIR